jgi:hypothetical protein
LPSNRNYRLKPDSAKADRAALNALNELPDYAPHNPAYSIEALAALEQALEQALKNEGRVQNEMTAAHDAARAAQWALHEALLGAKIQVAAQYGDDSDAIQSLGLKKRSKRQHGGGRAPKPNASPPPAPAENSGHASAPQ